MSLKLKKASIITKLVIAALVVYAVASILTTRARVAETQALRDELAAQSAVLQAKNADLEYDIENSGMDDTIEDIARDKLGLVLPGEIIFYDISD